MEGKDLKKLRAFLENFDNIKKEDYQFYYDNSDAAISHLIYLAEITKQLLDESYIKDNKKN